MEFYIFYFLICFSNIIASTKILQKLFLFPADSVTGEIKTIFNFAI